MKRIPSPWLELLGAVLLLLATFGASWLKPMGFAPSYMDAPPKKPAAHIQTLQLTQPAASAVASRIL